MREHNFIDTLREQHVRRKWLKCLKEMTEGSVGMKARHDIESRREDLKREAFIARRMKALPSEKEQGGSGFRKKEEDLGKEIFQAAKSNQVTKLCSLLERGGSCQDRIANDKSFSLLGGLLKGRGRDGGNTALIEASRRGHVEVVRWLLRCPDLDINLTNWRGYTALKVACETGQEEVVRLLLNRKKPRDGSTEIDVNRGSETSGRTPLMEGES